MRRLPPGVHPTIVALSGVVDCGRVIGWRLEWPGTCGMPKWDIICSIIPSIRCLTLKVLGYGVGGSGLCDGASV
ncbi:UNVERIFIED_CONTAM: hypothetical protein Sangu_1870400 [Sesamum angustifolium]|uniref:Uncharacterized protein n=1 Tax=Sesamum angustifolium TaxID=2727405 RepID=A0AAW2LXD4_9LAMI